VYSFVLLRTKDKEKCHDICQNIYLSFWQSLPRFKWISEAHFWAFLWKVARRQISRSRMNARGDVSIDEMFDIAAPVEEREDYRVLLKNLGELREAERLCLELRYFQDLKFEDIAQTLDISENNAKVIHHRAIKKLKEMLGSYE
jgi:RNA polymerase sigma-70 factor (ECF subfamily)